MLIAWLKFLFQKEFWTVVFVYVAKMLLLNCNVDHKEFCVTIVTPVAYFSDMQ